MIDQPPRDLLQSFIDEGIGTDGHRAFAPAEEIDQSLKDIFSFVEVVRIELDGIPAARG